MENIWIIIPGLNEAKYIKAVLKNTLKIHPNIIFVDDGSTDQTAKIASKTLKHVLIHDINLGKGSALKTGCDYAFKHLKATTVILMDSDNQHNPEELKNFIKYIKQGFDVVLGVRVHTGTMPLVRFLGNKLSSVLINVLFGTYFSDIPSGYKAITKKAYNKINWSSSGYEVETEIVVKIARNKLSFKEIPISTIYHDTDKGFTLLDALRILLKLPQWLKN